MVRSFDEEMKFLDKVTDTCWRIKKGFVPNMNVCAHHLQTMRCRRVGSTIAYFMHVFKCDQKADK